LIEYTDTTVFNTTAQTLVNTVNCVGVMGAGIALDFRLRYPSMYQDYLKKCDQKDVKIGKPYLYTELESISILNFPTKYHWKYPSKIEWIEQGLALFVSNYHSWNIGSIAFPQLGCGKGNLDWNDVQLVMEKYLDPLNIPVFICLDREVNASGIEGEMVSQLNKKLVDICSKLEIKTKTMNNINNHLPIQRFRELAAIEGIGKQTYESIFVYLYNLASRNHNSKTEIFDKTNHLTQTSMF